MAEMLQQDEIDALLKQIQTGEDPDMSGLIRTGEDGNERALRAACRALIHHYEIESPEYILNQCRRNIHELAHKQWLKKRKMTREEYIKMVRRILSERGLVWCPQNPPGYKLIKV